MDVFSNEHEYLARLAAFRKELLEFLQANGVPLDPVTPDATIVAEMKKLVERAKEDPLKGHYYVIDYRPDHFEPYRIFLHQQLICGSRFPLRDPAHSIVVRGKTLAEAVAAAAEGEAALNSDGIV